MNQPTDSVRAPENWPHAFTAYLEDGDVDGILSLYEPEARMLSPPRGELVEGHANIRQVVAGLIRSRAQLRCHVVKCVTTGDLAVLYTDFDGSLTDASGKLREVHQHAIEVLRRQPDGTWKLVFGDPVARGNG